MDLQQARDCIDRVDEQMAQLFMQRMEAAEQIAQYKKAHGLPIFDAQREAAVIHQGVARVDGPLQEYYRDFITGTMAISRRYQQSLLQDEHTVTVHTSQSSYPVTVLRGCLKQADTYLQLNRKVLIVTDSGVPEGYAKTVAACCAEPVIVTLPQGESSKNMENFALLCRSLLENGFTRTDCVVAVGGGMVGDLAGFAAASFMRGIDFYNIPTTVLSQVDSSVGGKTAIDLEGIKNCVGAFYQPKAVLIDPTVLDTLPQRQVRNGLAEAVKMAVLFDENLLGVLEEDPLHHLEEIIASAVRLKAAIVRADEKEAGLRRVLNFGHTIGHGLESTTSLLHGECVALGMLPMCSEDLRPRVAAILEKLGLPTICQADPEAVWQKIYHDKKRSGDQVTVVLAPRAGVFELVSISMEDLKQRVYGFLMKEQRL